MEHSLTAGYSALMINSTQYESLSSTLPITFVSSPRAAQSVLADSQKRFAAIFIDPLMTSPGGIRLISFAHEHRPVTPVYILYRHAPPLSASDLGKLSVHGALTVPLSSWVIRERIAPEIFDFVFENTPRDPYFGTRISEDEHYLSVPASDLLTGTPIFHDVFVRLPSARYVKILSSGDILSPARVLRYMDKGLTHFFLTQESHRRTLSYCDTLAHYLLIHPTASHEMKVNELFNQGQDVVDFLRTGKLTPEHVEFALTFIATLRIFLTEMKLDYHDKIEVFLNNLSAYDQAVSVTMVAGLLALPLGIEGDAAFRAIGLTSLFADISLAHMPEAAREDPSRYQTHPRLSAEMLADVSDIDPVVTQAIAQHHERRDNTGFPNRGGPKTINRVAELVGIADEFVQLLQKAKTDPSIDPLREMSLRVFDGFSYPVIESFRAIFIPQDRPGGNSPLTNIIS